jgi:epoxyqueuosine reductase
MTQKLLLHTCCGPCFLGSFEGLKDEGFEITSYYYSPNIYPDLEWEKRLKNLKIVADDSSVKVLESDYDPKEYEKAVSGKEDQFPKRCLDCYRLRLVRTAEKAKGDGYDAFSTTLLVSPYQNHEALKKIGEEVSHNLNIPFYYKDLRPFFNEGQQSAKEKNLYRQKYCGCKYSKEYR